MPRKNEPAARNVSRSGRRVDPTTWLLPVLLLAVLGGAWYFQQAGLFVTALVLLIIVLAGESYLPWRKTRSRERLLEGRAATPPLMLTGLIVLTVIALVVFPPAVLIPGILFLKTRGLPGGLRWEAVAHDGKVRLGARKTLGLLPVYPAHAVPTGVAGVTGPAVPAGSPVGHLPAAWCEYTLVTADKSRETVLRIPSVPAFRVDGPDGGVPVDVRGVRVDTAPIGEPVLDVLAGESYLPRRRTHSRERLREGRAATPPLPPLKLAGIVALALVALVLVLAALEVFPVAVLIAGGLLLWARRANRRFLPQTPPSPQPASTPAYEPEVTDLTQYTLRDLYRFAGYRVDDAEEGVEHFDEAAGGAITYGRRPPRRLGFNDVMYALMLLPLLLIPVAGWVAAAVLCWVIYFRGGRRSRPLPLDVPVHTLLLGGVTVQHRRIAPGEIVSVYGPVSVDEDGEHLFQSDTRDIVLVKSGEHRCSQVLPLGVFVFLLPVATWFLVTVVSRIVEVLMTVRTILGDPPRSAWSAPLWWWAIPAVLFLVLAGRYVTRIYNALVRVVNHVEYTWSLIAAALEKRAVLLEQLSRVVEKALLHEKSTLVKVTEGRWLAAGAVPGNEHDVRTESLTRMAPDIAALVEAYPVLKGDQTVTRLFTAIIAIENDIEGSRTSYNESVAHARTVLEMLPYRALAPLFAKRRKNFWEL